MNGEYEKIRKQKEFIGLALLEKKKQADIYSNKLMIKKKIKQISEQVKREVMKIREDLRARIMSKQKDEKRKRELIMNKIASLKKDISKDLLKASKNGNIDECNPDRATHEIIEYCKMNFDFDYSKMNECVKNDNFCYMCCESEFGDLHLESRSNCYLKCDDYYIYKIKFGKKLQKLKLTIDVTPYGVKTSEVIKNVQPRESINPPSINDKEIMPSHFLETKMITITKDTSNIKSNDDMKQLIEDEKKRELLMDIKEDLNF
jgi:hypothetical protein